MWKKGVKTLTKNKRKAFPVLILMIFSISFGSVMFDMQDARAAVMEETLEVTNYADGFVKLRLTNASNILSKVSSIGEDYIRDYEPRLVLQISFKIKGKDYDGLLIGINTSKQNHINTLVKEDKSELDDLSFSLSWNFADANNIEEGEEITLSVGSIEKEEKVESIGFNPEFNYVPLRKDTFIPSIDPYPVFYVDLEYIKGNLLLTQEVVINEVLYLNAEGADEDEVENKIKDATNNHLIQIIPKRDSYFIKSMREDEETDRQMLFVFLIVFLLGSVSTLVIIIHRLIEDDMKSVSVFMSLGATKSEVLGSYLLFNLLLIGISAVLGGISGFFLNIPLSSFITDLMGVPFFPSVNFGFFNIFWVALLLSLFSIGATLLVLRKSFHMDVQESMKYETKFLEKANYIERLINKVKKNVHPLTKYTLRRMFGKKVYLFLMIAVLAISTCFLIFAFSMPDSFKYSVNFKLDEVEHWDAMAQTWNFENETFLEGEMDSIDGIDEYEFGITSSIVFSKEENGDFEDYLAISAYQENSGMHTIHSDRNKDPQNDNEAIVSKDILHDFSLSVGDIIYVKNVSSDKIHEVEIIDFVNDMTEQTVFVTLDFADDILSLNGKKNAIYLTLEGDFEEISTELQDREEFQDVFLKEELRATLDEATELFVYFTVIFGGMFFIFGLLIVAIIVKNLVDYRLEDLANMKALGLKDSEIRKNITAEILIYCLIGIPLGYLLGILATFAVMDYFSDIIPGILPYIYPVSYFYVGIGLISIIVMVLLKQFKRLQNLNITELTKLKTFG